MTTAPTLVLLSSDPTRAMLLSSATPDLKVAEVLDIRASDLRQQLTELASLPPGAILLFATSGVTLGPSTLDLVQQTLAAPTVGLVGPWGHTNLGELVQCYRVGDQRVHSGPGVPHEVQVVFGRFFGFSSGLLARALARGLTTKPALLCEELCLHALEEGLQNLVADLDVSFTPEPAASPVEQARLVELQRTWCPRRSPVFLRGYTLTRTVPPRAHPPGVGRRIFGSLNSFLLPRQADNVAGLNQANLAFFQQLVQLDAFDEYHLFLDDPELLTRVRHAADQLLPPAIKNKVRLFDRLDLPAQLATTQYHVFHHADPYPGTLLSLRGRYSRQAFPVTAVTHTISNPGLYAGYLTTLISPHGPRDRIVCTSTCALQVLGTIYNDLNAATGLTPPRLTHLPLGVDQVRCVPRDRHAARQTLGLPQDRPIVLSLGRFSPQTKMDLVPLLHLLPSLRSSPGLDGLLVILAGSSSDESYLTTLRQGIASLGLEATVSLVLNPTEQAKPLLYNAADVFLSLSDNVQETFGLTILEALASGLPVVASDWNGYRDLVRDGQEGFLIPTLWDNSGAPLSPLTTVSSRACFQLAQSTVVDLSVCAQHLRTLLGNQTFRHELGYSARQRVEDHFTWGIVATKYLELWEALWREPEPPSRTSPDVSYLDLQRVFSHYPSVAGLDPGRTVVLTDFGRTCLTTGAELDAYLELAALLDLGMIQTLLSRAGSTVGTLLRLPGDPARLRFNLLWLLKNHYLELS